MLMGGQHNNYICSEFEVEGNVHGLCIGGRYQSSIINVSILRGKNLICRTDSVVAASDGIAQTFVKDNTSGLVLMTLTSLRDEPMQKAVLSSHSGDFVHMVCLQDEMPLLFVLDPRYVLMYSATALKPVGAPIYFATPELEMEIDGCWKLEGGGIAALSGNGSRIVLDLQTPSDSYNCHISSVVAFSAETKREVVESQADPSLGFGHFHYNVKFTGPGHVILQSQKPIRPTPLQISVTRKRPASAPMEC